MENYRAEETNCETLHHQKLTIQEPREKNRRNMAKDQINNIEARLGSELSVETEKEKF